MENNVKKLYLCNYGENTLDLPVVDYNDYEKLHKQLQQLKQECDLYKTWYRAKHDDLKNFLGQLKAENEMLQDSLGLANKYVNKYKATLDEIERICHENKEELNYLKDEYNFALVIIQLIKQAKEGE